MKIPFRLISLVVFIFFVSACQPRIQPIYVPSSVAVPPGLETAPLSAIGDGILAAGAEKGWVMEKQGPGVIRATLGVRGKHEAVVDVIYTNQSFDINYVSSRNLLSQGARIHRGYNTWVRELEISIFNNLGYVAAEHKANPKASGPLAAAPTPEVAAFDPAGIWNVRATYNPTAGWQSFCPKQRSWNFQLDYRKRGGIDETYWSNGVQLNVSGEHSADYSELNFSVPEGGSDWQLTKRLKLNKPQKRLTSEPKSSTSSNCIGVIDIIMKKQNTPAAARVVPVPAPTAAATPKPKPAAPAAAPQKPASALAPTPSAPANSAPLVATIPSTEAKFSAKGNWNVRANYQPDASNSSWCPKAADWDFALPLKNGKISETYYSNRKTIYVSGEMDDDYLDLRFNVPRGGIDWQWTKRFVLDQPDKRFSAVSRGGAGGSGCTGTINVHMKKQVQTATASPNPKDTKKSPPVVTTATAADIAWRSLKDKEDPAALRQYLKEHLDSKYAAVAIQNLNIAMARLSGVTATGPKPTGYDIRGTWRVTTAYTGAAANTSSCPKNPKWTFNLTLPDDNLSKSLWSGSEHLTVNNEGHDDKAQFRIVFPRGGSDWKWANRFILDQNRKTFLSESHGFGGTYGTCTGKLVFSMQKVR